jgi:hypothetical protein
VSWGGSVYGSTKAGVHQLTKAVAIEGAPFGIRATAMWTLSSAVERTAGILRAARHDRPHVQRVPALRKCRLGIAGRFSTDLDFCAPDEEEVLDVWEAIDGALLSGFEFSLESTRGDGRRQSRKLAAFGGWSAAVISVAASGQDVVNLGRRELHIAVADPDVRGELNLTVLGEIARLLQA